MKKSRHTVYLSRSDIGGKKYCVVVNGHRVHFGADGYSDYTKHKDPDRRRRYIQRHVDNENWGITGIQTPGFWSRWLLWNEPSLKSSIVDIKERFNINVVRT